MDKQELIAFFRSLDRSFFIDNENKKFADQDRPLPIGFGQTISQPSLVLQMTYLMDLNPDSKVLEIGTGSGFQTAVLAQFAGTVYTIERIPELAASARQKLEQLGYENIYYKVDDGSVGWSEHAPYDRIIVTAAAEKLPLDLIEQLSPGGRMLIPIGSAGFQELTLITRDQQGEIHTSEAGGVTFVEMKGKYGWTR
ncbi:MAG: protein-L-isoaspartate(D-aspartate) O-methyltransferase [Syntrophomonadaceae bacterium]|nr:protein-L-isoaspartate(D-aspartate) O-methyltransferase [Syntrophomonadaceae bacterium]